MSQRRVIPMSAKKKPQTTPVNENSIQDKAEIERMLKQIAEKMRDPKMTKKAALIISDMINQKKKGEK